MAPKLLGQVQVPDSAQTLAMLLGADVNLYRLSAGSLKTDGNFRIGGLGPTAEALRTEQGYAIHNQVNGGDIALGTNINLGATPYPFVIYANGQIEWGPGAATRDTVLYRLAAGKLKTNTDLEIGGDLRLGNAQSRRYSSFFAGVIDTTVGVVLGEFTFSANSQNIYLTGEIHGGNSQILSITQFAIGCRSNTLPAKGFNMWQRPLPGADWYGLRIRLMEDATTGRVVIVAVGTLATMPNLGWSVEVHERGNYDLFQNNAAPVLLSSMTGLTDVVFTSGSAASYIEKPAIPVDANNSTLADTLIATGLRIGSKAGWDSQAVVTDLDARLRDGGSTLIGNGPPTWTQKFADDFSVDQLSANYDMPNGSSAIAVSGGVYAQTTSSARNILPKIPLLGGLIRCPRITRKITTGGILSSPGYQAHLTYLDTTNGLYAGLVGNALRINKLDNNATTILKAVTPGIVLDATYWERAWIDSTGLVTAEVWSTDPALGGSPFSSTTYQLTPAEITKYLVPSQVGVRGAITATGTWTMDDLKIEAMIGDDGDFYRQADSVPPYSVEYGPRTNDGWGTGRVVQPQTARAHEVYELASTGDTGALGSAFQNVPGLTQTLTLEIGDVVLLDAAVRLEWANNASWPTAHFTITDPDAIDTYRTMGSQLALYGLTVTAGGGAVVPVTERWVATKAGSHTFRVQATNQGTGGGGKALGGSGASKMRVVRLGGLYGPQGPQGLQGPAGSPDTIVLNQAPVLDVGQVGQIRAGRQFTVADFTALGLSQPLGLFNLSDLTNIGSDGRALTNKGTVPFGIGINGQAATAAVFAGSTAQVLYIPDSGAADPFRIRTGSWGCWFRTGKRGTQQTLLSKLTSVLATQGFSLFITNTGNAPALWFSDGTVGLAVGASTDVCDDRWHFAVGVHDGNSATIYVDGIPELTKPVALINANSSGPLNIGGETGDASVATGSPHYGRVDEAFVTSEVLTPEQIRLLYCARLTHTLGAAPSRVTLNIRRQRRGGPLAVTDFPTQPLRLYNFTGRSLADQGSNNVALTSGAADYTVAADGIKDSGRLLTGAVGGSDNSTDAGLPAGTAARSFGCWFKTITTAIGILAWGTGVGDCTLRCQSSTGLLSSVTTGGDTVTGPFVADGQWHFGVVVEDNTAADGLKRKLYCDGRLVGGSTVLGSITLAGATRFRVGALADGSVTFVGQISRVFVCGYALTGDQVLALYNKSSQMLAPSPKNAGDHVESLEAATLLASFESLDSPAQIDMAATA